MNDLIRLVFFVTWLPRALTCEASTWTEFSDCLDSSHVTIRVTQNLTRDAYISIEQPKQVTIYGNGHTIDGAEAIILSIESGVHVTVHDLIFFNGKNVNGGAVYNKGSMTMHSCTFDRNSGSGEGGYGGAVYNKGTLEMDRCHFIQNDAETKGGAVYNKGTLEMDRCHFIQNDDASGGGAVYNADANLTANSCVFASNRAITTIFGDGRGGAMYNEAGGEMTLYDCTYTGNEAEHGGGVYNEGTMNLYDCTFNDNSADYGGALENRGMIDDVERCEFTGNTVTSNGGAIEHSLGNISNIVNCTFWGNHADDDGGAVFIDESADRIDGCNFTSNTANLGGALYIENTEYTVSMSIFNGNRASNNGGAVYISPSGSLTLTESTSFNCNLADNDGGTLYSNGGSLRIENCGASVGPAAFSPEQLSTNFTVSDCELPVWNWGDMVGALEDNVRKIRLYDSIHHDGTNFPSIEHQVTIYGGNHTIDGDQRRILTILSGGDVTLHQLTLTNGKAGGGLAAVTKANTKGKAKKKGTNNPIKDGGAVSNDGALAAYDCTFSANEASDEGGAVYNNGTLVLYDCTFTENLAESGGALSNFGTIQNLTGCVFTENRALNDGGAFVHSGGAIQSMENCTFTRNFADDMGGAVFMNARLLRVAACTFTNNTAVQNGGGMYNGGTIEMMATTRFESNRAHATGGAVFVGQTGSLALAESTSFNCNLAQGNGSAIYAVNESALSYPPRPWPDPTKLTNDHCVQDDSPKSVETYEDLEFFLYNQVSKIVLLNDLILEEDLYLESDFEIDGNEHGIVGRMTIRTGGVMRNLRMSHMRLTSTFRRLSTALYGAIYVEINDGTTFVMSSMVVENGYAMRGAGVYVQNGTVVLQGVDFENNTALEDGGAVFSQGTMTIQGCTFRRNSANDGGAVWSNGTLSMNASVWTNNTAVLGGALVTDGSVSEMMDCTYDQNSASDKGGAIYVQDGSLSMSECHLMENDAPNGGGVYVVDGALTMDECHLMENRAVSSGGAVYNENGDVDLVESHFTCNDATNGSVMFSQSTVDVSVESGSAYAPYATNSFEPPAIGANVTTVIAGSCPICRYIGENTCVLHEDFAGEWNVAFDDHFVMGRHPTFLTTQEALNSNVTTLVVHGEDLSIGHFLVRGGVHIFGDNVVLHHTLVVNSNVVVRGTTISFLEVTMVNSTLHLDSTIQMDRVVMIQSRIEFDDPTATLTTNEYSNYVLGSTLDSTVGCRNHTLDPCVVFRNTSLEVTVMDPLVQHQVVLDPNCTFEGPSTTCPPCEGAGLGRLGVLGRCDPCFPGTYSEANECRQCAPGKFTNAMRRGECEECEDGWYQPSAGGVACEQCTPRTEVAVNRTECVACPQGKWTGDGIQCENCVCVDPYTEGTTYVEDGGFCVLESNCEVYCDPTNQTFERPTGAMPIVGPTIRCGSCDNGTWTNPVTNVRNGTCDPSSTYVSFTEFERGFYCDVQDQEWHEVETGQGLGESCGVCNGLFWTASEEADEVSLALCEDTCNTTTHRWNKYSDQECGQCVEQEWIPAPLIGKSTVTCNATTHRWIEYPNQQCGTCNGTGYWSEPPLDLTVRRTSVVERHCTGTERVDCQVDGGYCYENSFGTSEWFPALEGTNMTCNQTSQRWEPSGTPCGVCANGEWLPPPALDGVVLVGAISSGCLHQPSPCLEFRNTRNHPYTRSASTFDDLSPALSSWYECNTTDHHWWEIKGVEPNLVEENTSLPCGECTNGTWSWFEGNATVVVNGASVCTVQGEYTFAYPDETEVELDHWAPPLVCKDGVFYQFTPRVNDQNVSLQTWWDRELEWRPDASYTIQWVDERDWVDDAARSTSYAQTCDAIRHCDSRDVLCGEIPCFVVPGSDPYWTIERTQTRDAVCPIGWRSSGGEQWTCTSQGELVDPTTSATPLCEVDTENACQLPHPWLYPMTCQGPHFYRDGFPFTTYGTNCTADCNEGWMGCPNPCADDWEGVEICSPETIIEWDRPPSSNCDLTHPPEGTKCFTVVDGSPCVARLAVMPHEDEHSWVYENGTLRRVKVTLESIVSPSNETTPFIWVIGYTIAAIEAILWGVVLYSNKSVDGNVADKSVTSTVFILLIVWFFVGLGFVTHFKPHHEYQYVAMIAVGLPLYGFFAVLIWRQNTPWRALTTTIPCLLALFHLFGYAAVQIHENDDYGSVPLVLAAIGGFVCVFSAVCMMLIVIQSRQEPKQALIGFTSKGTLRLPSMHRKTY